MQTCCKYCGFSFEGLTKGYKTSHVKKCDANPNKGSYKTNGGINQFTNNPGLKFTEEQRARISESMTGFRWSEERKARHSLRMSEVVKTKPESYSVNRMVGRKKIEIDGFKLDSDWELKFYNWAKQSNIKLSRVSTPFPYNFEGKTRSYFPDFYLPELGIYVEVKGYLSPRCKAKIEQFPNRIVTIAWPQIEAIENGSFGVAEFMKLL